jgi:hypothetical protein
MADKGYDYYCIEYRNVNDLKQHAVSLCRRYHPHNKLLTTVFSQDTEDDHSGVVDGLLASSQESQDT